METFKNPLTPEEEKKYIGQCLAGCKAARHALIEYNLRLVAHIAKKYSSAFREPEELLSVGTIGLIKAIDTYRPDKGCRLASYASKCIENEYLMLLRQEKKKMREVSMYEPVGTDREGNEIVIMDIISAPADSPLDNLITAESISALPGCMSGILTGREKLIISMRYGLDGAEPMTQKEAAASLGISRSYVSRIEKKALQKLRSCLDR